MSSVVDNRDLSYLDREGGHLTVPALSGFFYFDGDVHVIAGELADGIERYVQYTGLEVLKNYPTTKGQLGWWKPLTPLKLNKDLKHLRNFPRDHRAVTIEYDAGNDRPGGFGLYVHAYENDENFDKRLGLLRVDWSRDWLAHHDVDEFIELVSGIVQLPHVQSANVGFTFKTTSRSAEPARYKFHTKLPLYLGFAPCYFHLNDEMRGHTFTAHWLNYLDRDLVGSLGGRKAIDAALRDCEIRTLKQGVLIRAAKLPPVGDVKHKAPDLGSLPNVARLLQPTRPDIETISEVVMDDEDFDALQWIERLDHLKAGPWDNAGPPKPRTGNAPTKIRATRQGSKKTS